MLEISQNCNLPQTKQTLISEVWPWLKMPPVSIPQEAGCSSAGPSTSTLVNPIKISTAQPAWPEQIQAKITQLEKVGIGIQNGAMMVNFQELEEEEITKKGFWRKKLELVEKLLTRQQAKDLALLLEQVGTRLFV